MRPYGREPVPSRCCDLRRLIAEEAAAGLLETYERHLATDASDQEAAHAALAEFGDLATVAGEFTRQAPGRRAARQLLATGPVAGSCWAAALITGHAWTWPLPATARLAFGAVLLLAILTLLAAATSQHSYQRTRLAIIASPVILVLDATALTAAMLTAPALTWALATAWPSALAGSCSPPGHCPASLRAKRRFGASPAVSTNSTR